MENKKTVIFDLDGTLADISERRALATSDGEKINWAKFFDPQNVKMDTPNWPVIEAFKAFKAQGHEMVIFSGRSDATMDATITWLKEYDIDFDNLLMRPNKPPLLFMKDDELKQMWLNDQFPTDADKKNILCVFDDRDKVVDMWRRNGIPCFQVAPGDF